LESIPRPSHSTSFRPTNDNCRCIDPRTFVLLSCKLNFHS
jgi:hypothetical protein